MKINYEKIAKEARKTVLRMIFKAQTSHIGSVMSCADIMAVLFEKIDLDRDRFVLSAGWKAAMLYYHLWRKGRITEEELNSYCQPGSKWIGLSEPIHPDIPIAGGSMGLGLPGAVGLALAKKLKGEEGKVYVLLSDGEMQCGTTWESALIASHHKLNSLVVIVDYNKLQAMGETNKILRIEPLVQKWLSFGWHVIHIDGHDYKGIEEAVFNRMESEEFSVVDSKPWLERPKAPVCVIADTIKGKGVSKFEGNNFYHYKNLSDEEYSEALKELNL